MVAPSTFEGCDGDLITNQGGFDWSSITSDVTALPDGTGGTDPAFANGSKEQDPDSWNIGGFGAPSKSDILAAAIKTDPVSGDLFLYGAFERLSGSGDANVSFELNQVGTTWDNDNNPATAEIPLRTDGDLMITFDGNNSGGIKVGMCRWYGDRHGEDASGDAFGWYPIAAYPLNTVTPIGAKLDSNTDCTTLSTGTFSAQGAMNEGTLSNPGYIPGFSASIPDNDFGEMVVDITKALATLQDPGPCFAFGSVWMHSRSATSATSSMQDYVSPRALRGAASCKIAVDKTVAVNGGPYHDGTPADPSWADEGDTLNYALEVTNEGVQTVTLDSVVDANCSGPTLAPADQQHLSGQTLVADASPATFDMGDVWTYRCTHVLASGDSEPYVNTVTVDGHAGTQPLTATDSAATGRFGKLVLTKRNVGGTQTDAFTFTPSADLSGAGAFAWAASNGDKTFTDVVPNVAGTQVYSLAEALAPTYTLTAITCQSGLGAGAPTDADSTTSLAGRTATATVSPGEIVHCTFENTHETTLTVIKTVITDDGGTAGSSAFTMNVTAANVSNASFPGSSTGTTVTLDPGSYSVDESGGPSGYAKTLGANCSGTIAVGQHKTCTITNNDIAPRLTVTKHVINNNGGGAPAGQFTMNVTGPSVSTPSFAGSELGTTVTLDAGSYSVDESGGPSGYAKTLGANCSGTIAIGETKSCTITNDDIAPQLTVIKHVINDAGGTATAGQFTMNVTGTNVSTGSFPGAEAPGTTVTVNAGSYSVDESGGPSGYAKTLGANCSGTIAVGQSKTCTITNNDIAPQLTVIKHVVNDDGGNATAGQFTMNVTGLSVSTPSFAGSELGTTVTLNTGSYSVDESGGPAGYVKALSANCSGTIAIGQSRTCTITNNDIGALLIVKKVVVNDNGGTKTPSDFTMQVSAVNPSQTSFPGSSAGTSLDVDAGNYSVDEGSHSGYSKSLDAGCSGSITIGQTKTCTITNDDIQPTLVVTKIVDNEGVDNAVPSDFTMQVTGPSPNPSSFPGASAGTNVALNAGSYSVTETGARTADYNATFSSDCNASIAIGETKTCTITNTRILHPAISIDKTGPAMGQAGDVIGYSMAVKNTGDDPFADPLVVLADALCEAPPLLTNKNGDASPATLDPGETWIYTCSVATQVGQDSVHNVATVAATDSHGKKVTAEDVADTALTQPVQEILPEIIQAGRASLRGPSGCPSTKRPSKAYVTGVQIENVTFKVDGRKLRTILKPDSKGRWAVSLYPGRMRYGSHRLTATVVFKPVSGTTTKTLVLRFNRCRPAIIAPTFTG